MSVDSKRKHLTRTTQLASTLLKLGLVPYDDAKRMHEEQIISLYEWHHVRPHAYKDTNLSHLDIPDVDHFSNYEPLPIKEHREQTKSDVKLIAKSKRLRARMEASLRALDVSMQLSKEQLAADFFNGKFKRKIQSRGFNKTLTRKLSGKVVKREE